MLARNRSKERIMKRSKLYLSLLLLMTWSAISHAGLYNVGMFWQIADKTDPTCSISSAISGWRTNSTETINFSCTDDTGLATVQCRVNGAAWVACSSWTQHTISGLSSGSSTTFEVRSTDVYGRVSAVAAGQTRSWSTDATAPSVSITGISGTNTGNPSISFSGSDAHSGLASYQCSYDTGSPSWGGCGSPANGSTGNAGWTYYFRVRSFDNAGNVSAVAQTGWTNGNWGGYTGCNVSCGGGTNTRYCNNPSPSGSPAGMGCSGAASVSCNTQPCCVNGSLTTNMCPGYVYYAASSDSCLGCPGSVTKSATVTICTDNVCTAEAGVSTVSCASGSATVTNDGGCPAKTMGGIYSCQCN